MHAPDEVLADAGRPIDRRVPRDQERTGSSRPAEGEVTRPGGPGAAARLLARIRPVRLDRALIAGADPADSAQLSARAARLRSLAFRSSLADGLERWVGVAGRAPTRTRVGPPRDAVLDSASELLELAEILRRRRPPDARCIAISVRLLSDGTGQAYVASPERLRVLLNAARAVPRQAG